MCQYILFCVHALFIYIHDTGLQVLLYVFLLSPGVMFIKSIRVAVCTSSLLFLTTAWTLMRQQHVLLYPTHVLLSHGLVWSMGWQRWKDLPFHVACPPTYSVASQGQVFLLHFTQLGSPLVWKGPSLLVPPGWAGCCSSMLPRSSVPAFIRTEATEHLG